MSAIKPIELRHPALYCAAGSEWPQLWQALQETPRPSPWPLAADGRSGHLEAYAVPDPALALLGIDRKVARTMEKQAQLCVAGAAASLQQWPQRSPEILERTGLYLGLASIDEEVPPLSALQRRDSSNGEAWLQIMLSETPPFSGLSMLNSSACAHISGSFGLRGALAAFSPFCDAGLQALIEGALSVAEGENRYALIGAVSPKLHPLLSAQYGHWGWCERSGAALGEGAAFVLACGPDAAAPDAALPTLHLVGYARGFVPPAANGITTAAFAGLFDQALASAGRDLHDIGWILPAACLSPTAADRQTQALAELFGRAADALPIARVEQAIGILGAAEPLVHTGLAAAALSASRRLVWHAASRRHDEEPLNAPTVMLTAWAPHGQCVIVLLERGTT